MQLTSSNSPRRTLFMFLCSTDGVIKSWQKYHQFGKNWNNFGDFSNNSAVLHITTKLVTEQCKLNMQYCMIHHINQNCSADAKMYHTWLYVKCTMIYDHKCTQFWRSVSASGHGNMILNKLPPPTRVRSRRNLNRGGNALILILALRVWAWAKNVPFLREQF